MCGQCSSVTAEAMRLFEVIVVVIQEGNANLVAVAIAFLKDNLCATI